MAIRMDVGAGRDDLRGLIGDPAQHHRRAGARPPARTMTTTAWVIDKVKSRIGVDGPEVTAPVEAGHFRPFAAAIRAPNPRWAKEAPPTRLGALAAAPPHLHGPE